MSNNKSYVDESIRCGDDFFKYATNKWIEEHPQPMEHSRWGVFDFLAEENIKKIKKIVTKGNGDDISEKMCKLYNQYIDERQREKDGLSFLSQEIEEIKNISTLQEYIDKMTALDICPFWNITDGPDDKCPKNTATFLYQGGMSLGNREYYLNTDDNTMTIVKAFKKYVRKLLSLVGYTPKETTMMFREMMKIEKSIAKDAYSVEDTQEPSLNYHLRFVEALSKKYKVDLYEILSKYGYTNTTRVIVCQEIAVKKGFQMLTKLPLSSLKNYLIIRLLIRNTRYLTRRFRKAEFELSKVMEGAKKPMPVKKEALEAISNLFDEYVGKVYAEKYFTKKEKHAVTNLVNNLIVEYATIIAEQDWMSDETKRHAVEKLGAMTIKVGYPEKQYMDYLSAPFDETKPFIYNINTLRLYFHRKHIALHHNKPVDKDEWHMQAHYVNAYYNPTTNEICFPCGILQAPFYAKRQSDAYNYGAIGAIIGHEMTHGFDNHGRQYDKSGIMKMWWKDEEIAKFNEFTKRTIEHYSTMDVLPDLKCNGTLTLGENLADYGGLKIAWRAFNKLESVKKMSEEERKSAQKDFFINYATAHAGVESEESMRQNTLSNEHPVSHVRINGSLAMFTPWYETFGVTETDKMYIPEDRRALIW